MGYAFNPHFKLKLIDLTTTATVAPAGDDQQLLQPPAGKTYQIIGIIVSLPDPVGSAAGTHRLQCRQYDGTNYNVRWSITSDFGNLVTINQNGFGGTTESPNDGARQYQLMYDYLFCSNSLPIDFNYDNDTDVNQSGSRVILVWVKEFTEVK